MSGNKELNMLKMKNLTTSTTLLGLITLAIFGLAGCGGEQATADRHVIPVKINTGEDEKVVFVNNFVNLTDNQDLNIFEEGLADMLEETLTNIPSIKVVPRHSMKTMFAVSDAPKEHTIVDTAKSNGVQYIIDGWIGTTDKGTYKAYANLINLEGEKEEIHNRFAVVEFDDRNNALQKINNLVEEVASKLSRNREELEGMVKYQDFDYNFFLTYHTALSSANRGRPDVAISMMESTLADYMKRLAIAEDEKERHELRNMTLYARFLLMQAYVEVGDHENSQRHIEAMALTEQERKNMGMWATLVDALSAENNGQYAKAAEKYSLLAEKRPYESFFYIRLSDIALQQGDNSKKALSIVKRGLEMIPDSSLLNKQAAKIRMDMEGEKAIEEYASESVDSRNAAVTAEVVSSLINDQLEEEMLKKNPDLVPLVVNVQAKADGTFTYVGRVKVDTDKLEYAIDYSCPDTTESVVKMANFAVRSGNVKFAYKVADNIKTHGTAPNSIDAYHTIYALAKTADGAFDEAKKHAVQINKDEPTRYLVIGNLLLHQGNNEKAVKYMEKALQLDKEPHPLVYYNIANAHLLAGHYKEWNNYNEKFLEASVKLGLIPKSLKDKILALPIERVVVRNTPSGD